MKYTVQSFNNVTNAYSSENFLRYDGDVIRPLSSNLQNSVWLIVLHGTVTTNSASLYIVVIGTTQGDTAVMEIGHSGAIFPEVRKDANGSLYVAWSGDRTAFIRANLFKLY